MKSERNSFGVKVSGGVVLTCDTKQQAERVRKAISIYTSTYGKPSQSVEKKIAAHAISGGLTAKQVATNIANRVSTMVF